jgi:hypothetical protein
MRLQTAVDGQVLVTVGDHDEAAPGSSPPAGLVALGDERPHKVYSSPGGAPGDHLLQRCGGDAASRRFMVDPVSEEHGIGLLQVPRDRDQSDWQVACADQVVLAHVWLPEIDGPGEPPAHCGGPTQQPAGMSDQGVVGYMD